MLPQIPTTWSSCFRVLCSHIIWSDLLELQGKCRNPNMGLPGLDRKRHKPPVLSPGSPALSKENGHVVRVLEQSVEASTLMSIESVMPSSHLILCRPLLLLPPIPPSIRVFPNESTLHMRWPKFWSFSFSIIPSKEIPGLISFRMDWLDLLAVQGTLKNLLQHHNWKA